MKRRLVAVAILTAMAGLSLVWLLTQPQAVRESELPARTANAENGRAMFFAGGCASCHATPNQDDRTRLGGGRALKSPFGVFYAPNVSSDKTDGIGGWSEAQFVTAMLKGTSPNGRHYYPSFPYTSYQRMRLDDVRDLYAFMLTLPPSSGRVREHDLPFPFTVRRGLGLWKLLYLEGEPFRSDPARSPEWNRGAYLVNGPGHCAECHSARDAFGGLKSAQRFAGGPNPEGEGWVPNITPARLKDWSEGDFVDVLTSGLLPDGDSVGGSMVPVVRNTSQLSADDRKAMAVYLKSLPPIEGPKRPPKKE